MSPVAETAITTTKTPLRAINFTAYGLYSCFKHQKMYRTYTNVVIVLGHPKN